MRTAHVLPASWRQYLVDSDPEGTSENDIDACERWFEGVSVGSCIESQGEPFVGVYDGQTQICLVYTFRD